MRVVQQISNRHLRKKISGRGLHVYAADEMLRRQVRLGVPKSVPRENLRGNHVFLHWLQAGHARPVVIDREPFQSALATILRAAFFLWCYSLHKGIKG